MAAIPVAGRAWSPARPMRQFIGMATVSLFELRVLLFIMLIATIILPTQVTLIPKYILFRQIGWCGTWWPLIVPHFFANAYNVFLLRQYFRSIPRELDEAATIDGASPWQTLLYVIISQSWPAILAVGLFHFFWAWND